MSDEKNLDFDVDAQEKRDPETIYKADSAGFVIALITSGGEASIRGTIAGYADKTAGPKQRQAFASIHYNNTVLISHSSFCMPVGRNENWVVRAEGGNTQHVEIFWLPLRVDF